MPSCRGWSNGHSPKNCHRRISRSPSRSGVQTIGASDLAGQAVKPKAWESVPVKPFSGFHRLTNESVDDNWSGAEGNRGSSFSALTRAPPQDTILDRIHRAFNTREQSV